MSRPAIDLKNPALAALLAWLVPGLGHLYQGRTRKGLLYMGCILGLYLVGFTLGRGQVVYWTWVDPRVDSERFRLPFLLQMGVGLPAIWAVIQSTLKYLGNPTIGTFLAEPSIQAINALHPGLGKLLEIAFLYTMMAGLLNVLAIFDAYAGPAVEAHPAETPEADGLPQSERLKAGAGA